MAIQKIAKLVDYINAHHHEAFTFCKALDGGYQDGAILLINSTGKPFILKQWYRTQAIPLLAILEVRGYPSKAPIITGQTDNGEKYWIQEYQQGRPMESLKAEYIDQIEMINSLQARCIDPLPQDIDASWSTYAYQVVFHNGSGWFEMLRAYSPEVAVFVEMLQQWAMPWQETPLVHTDAVHGDFTPDNLIVQGNRITGVIDTAAMGCGTRAIDMATLLHYAYLYEYPEAIKHRLHTYIVNHFDKGTIYITLTYRILAMLAWAAEHDPHEIVKQYMERSSKLLQTFA